ncbi:MAG: 1-(5-phosphoribosyl)-5-[(5-phosphoribosylamino)methylideneamino] imidazole-4-carboxamide isomerase [Gammaproteobacteria bacterium]|nr:1-(5-phosphoribosyl)-5-[(5-phosphoribosylamino)methylideneamino] imidazole-4-carboxamide isomerase [Gammaproteobacteria bacterium]
MELIPSIDLRAGTVVRLRHGDFAAETRYPTSAAGLLARYAAAGARRLHVVDLDGARDGVPANEAVLRELARSHALAIQAAGGVREAATAARLLAAGAARVVVGSVAIESPDDLLQWLAQFGADRLVAALDVRLDAGATPRLASRGWQRQTQQSLWDLVGRLGDAGLRHVLCTDIGRDGALGGPNLDLYRDCIRRFPAIAWQASGGVRDAADLHALAGTGVAAAISGKALLEGRISDEEMAPFLPAA